MTKSASHICCMPISDQSRHHNMDKFLQHVCFPLCIVRCYWYVYKREWCHMYCNFPIQLFPLYINTCIMCAMRDIYKAVFSVNREEIHYGHFVLHCRLSTILGFEWKRWIHIRSVHRDENHLSDNFWWVLHIQVNM